MDERNRRHERIEAVVTGKVQMVMYRDFATRKARGLDLVGETKNLPDGTVRVVAEGPREHLELYLGKLNEGPVLARVDEVIVTWQDATGEYQSFSITY